MVGLRGALAGLFALGALLTGGVVGAVWSSGAPDRALVAVVVALLALSYLGVGCYAWWRRPRNRLGALLSATAFAWLVGALAASDTPWLFTAATLLGPLAAALLAHVVLALPSGRLGTTPARVVVLAAWADVLLVRLPSFVLGSRLDDGLLGGAVPRNVLAVAERPERAAIFEGLALLVGLALVVAVLVLVARPRRLTPTPQRRAQLAGALALACGALATVGVAPAATTVVALGLALVVPYALLAGLVRTRSRAAAVGELVERLADRRDEADLRDSIADALGDPGLELVFWRQRTGEYVTRDGERATIPPTDGRVHTEVEREGRHVGAFIHDAALCDEPGLLRAVAASTALALENERLEAELRARVAELQDSRARIVEVSTAERRRLERDLHDGAQQRLVALALQLGLARRRVEHGDERGATVLLDGARDELGQALAELRELARGIHPAILTDRGLGPALEALADRAPLPVQVDVVLPERLPATVEAAAYFVVAESLTNAAKHARAASAVVTVRAQDGRAVVEVADDGVGGADARGGSGLRGLSDRVAALDGRLSVRSRPGRGTTVRAEVPL